MLLSIIVITGSLLNFLGFVLNTVLWIFFEIMFWLYHVVSRSMK